VSETNSELIDRIIKEVKSKTETRTPDRDEILVEEIERLRKIVSPKMTIIESNIESILIDESWAQYVEDESSVFNLYSEIRGDRTRDIHKAGMKIGFNAGWWYCLEKKLGKGK